MAQQPQQPPMAQMLPPDATEDGQAAQYYQQETGDLTGGLPINLDSLRDGPPGSKPFYPYSTLIRYAIKGSPNQKLLLEDIYYAIESRFPYFRNAPNGWKNSVRHNLSLNPCFEKVPRPLTDRGKGSYWTVNDHVDPRTGVHRIRKKRGKKVNRIPSDEEGDIDYHPPEAFDEAAATTQFVSNQQQLHPDPAAQDLSQFQPNPAQFDPLAYPLMPRFSPFPIHISPEEGLELDEHGNIDWRLAWLKELGHLQHLTTEQDKAGADQDWYRMMMFRVRSAMLAPINPAEMVIGPPPIPSQQPNMAVGEVQDPQRQ